MSLFDTIQNDVKDAMRAKDKLRLTTLRSIVAEAKKQALDSGKDITDENVIAILAKGIKSRQESSKMYRDAGRDELADQEDQEIEIYRTYQPEQMAEEDIEKIVAEAIAAVGASAPSDMGKVMGKLMPQVKGKADGQLVSATVKRMLS